MRKLQHLGNLADALEHGVVVMVSPSNDNTSLTSLLCVQRLAAENAEEVAILQLLM